MGLFTTNKKELYNLVKERFGETNNYLIALKYNTLGKSILKSIISTVYRNIDSNREYILYFDENGIHEKELSFSDNAQFLLIPWHEIEDFIEENKRNKIIIKINHLGKFYSYEIFFDGRIMEGNRERVRELKENNYYR